MTEPPVAPDAATRTRTLDNEVIQDDFIVQSYGSGIEKTVDRPPGPRIARPTLIALCVGANLLEASLLAALGPASALALAPQASAVAPLGVFHDLRWLVVYADSWDDLAVKGLALLAARSALTALCVLAAWPDGIPRPNFRRCFLRAVVFNLFAGLLLAPMAVLLFGLAVAPVSWFWFAAVPSAAIIAVLFHHGAITPGWWRQGMSARAIGWILFGFGLASVAGAVITAVPAGFGVAVAGVAGLANAWAWRGLVRSVLALGCRARLRPVAPSGLIAFAGIVVGGTVIGFAAVAPTNLQVKPVAISHGIVPGAGGDTRTVGVSSSPIDSVKRATAGGKPKPSPGCPGPRCSSDRAPAVAVLVVTGYGTSWDGRSSPGLPGPYVERRFSYRGLALDGQPVAYTSADTNQPLVHSERLMAAQVAALHQATGDPVALVAESEGSLVAKAYLDADPGGPVRYLIMTSPLVNPARVYYPPLGSVGMGLAGGEGLSIISSAVRSVAPIPLSPTSPFLRSLVDESASLGGLLSCPLPGIAQAALLPLADAVGSPSGIRVDIPTLVLVAFHGGMLTNPSADRAIDSVLSGQPLPSASGTSLARGLVRSLASAWQVPGPDGESSGASSCEHARTALEAQLSSR
ncbi:MAG: hypothetical protein ACRDX8_08115 [Acidimicrobiales bacterium]